MPAPPAIRYRRVYTNGRAGSCRGCGQFVRATDGVSAEPAVDQSGAELKDVRVAERAPKRPWDLFCRDCGRKRGLSIPIGDEHFTLTVRDAGHLALEQRRAISSETFDWVRMVAQAHGGRYEGLTGVTLVPIERADALVGSLMAKVCVDCLEDVTLRLAANIRRRDRDLESALARVDRRRTDVFEYQRYGVQWLASRRRALLADEMGLGKTVQALLSLPGGDHRAPVLVAAPASARGVWVAECRRWRPDYAAAVVRGKEFCRPAPGHLIVHGYDALPREDSDLLLGTIAVLDEAHFAKNPKSGRSVRAGYTCASALSGGGRVWLLTGTPVDRHPEDLWHLLQLAELETEIFGSYDRMAELYGSKWRMHPCHACGHVRRHSRGRGCHVDDCECKVENTEHRTWGLPSPEVSALVRRGTLRRLRADVLPDLPEKTYQDHPVDLSRELLREVDELLPEGWREAVEASLAGRGELPEFAHFSAARAKLAHAKLAAAADLVESFEEAEEPLVVFSCHEAALEVFREREGWGLIVGSTPSKRRHAIAEDFQGSKLRGLAGNVVAMGTGLTLTRACHVLFVDEPWNPSQLDQAADRLCRVGQTRGVVVHCLCADHALDRLARALAGRKRAVMVGSLDGDLQESLSGV